MSATTAPQGADKETTAQLRKRIAKGCLTVLERLNAGNDTKADIAQEVFPEYADRIEFFFMLDMLHPDRMTALKMVVDAYNNRTPLPKIGGVPLW